MSFLMLHKETVSREVVNVNRELVLIKWFVASLRKKATIHQVTTMLATLKMPYSRS